MNKKNKRIAFSFHYYGDFYKSRKVLFIPTFYKRINLTSTALGRWVAAFEERRQMTFSVTIFIYNKQQTGIYTKWNKQQICKSSKKEFNVLIGGRRIRVRLGKVL